MKSKRERFTDRLNDVQGAQALMMSNLEDAYDYILKSFATTTKLAIDAADAEIERLKKDELELMRQNHPLFDKLRELQRLAYLHQESVDWRNKPWWKRLFS